MAETTELKLILTATDKGIKASIDGVTESLESADKKTKTFKSSLNKTSKILSSIGNKTGIAFAGMAASIGGFLKTSGNFEQWSLAFETMLGSTEKAKTLLSDIKEFAASTPFELPGLVESSKKLLAYNIEAEKIIPTLESLGNITAGVGAEKMPQLITAFGQVKAATRLTGQELRQFSEAGVPLLDTLADQFGVTAEKMQKMISEGSIGFEDVEKALFSLSGEGGKFADLMSKQSKTFLGTISNIKDNLTQLFLVLGDSLLPIAKRVSESIKNITDRLKDLPADQIESIASGILKVTAALGAATVAIKATSIAMAVLAANPVTLAISGTVAVLTLLILNLDTLKKVAISVWDTFNTVFSSIGKLFGKLGEIVAAFIKRDFKSLKKSLSEVKDVGSDTAKGLAEIWSRSQKDMSEKSKETTSSISDGLKTVSEGLKTVQEESKETKTSLEGDSKSAIESIAELATEAKEKGKDLGTHITDGLKSSIKESFDKSVTESLKKGFNKSLHVLIPFISGAIGGIVSTALSGLFGGKRKKTVEEYTEEAIERISDKIEGALDRITGEKSVQKEQLEILEDLEKSIGPNAPVPDSLRASLGLNDNILTIQQAIDSKLDNLLAINSKFDNTANEQLLNTEKSIDIISKVVSGSREERRAAIFGGKGPEFDRIVKIVASASDISEDSASSLLRTVSTSTNSIARQMKRQLLGILNALQDQLPDLQSQGLIQGEDRLSRLRETLQLRRERGIEGFQDGGILGLSKLIPKFANGGILGGNSLSGDKLLFRGNSGEMILNRPQQARLFGAIKSGNISNSNSNVMNDNKTVNISIVGSGKSGEQIYQEIAPFIEAGLNKDVVKINRGNVRSFF